MFFRDFCESGESSEAQKGGMLNLQYLPLNFHAFSRSEASKMVSKHIFVIYVDPVARKRAVGNASWPCSGGACCWKHVLLMPRCETPAVLPL